MKASFQRFRYRAARTSLNVPLNWLRHRGLDSTDVFLASYPRSGQHWTRFLLFEILTGKSADFDILEDVIPKMGAHGKAPAILPEGGRLIQTHQPWRMEYKRAINLVRDVRDVVLSDYAMDESLDLARHFDITDFDSYLMPWLHGKVQTMGSWQDHVNSWLDSPLSRNGNLLVIKYEDMRKDPYDVLIQMVNFIGAPLDKPAIRDAIANNSLERMRAKEDSSKKYAPQALGRKSGEEYRFVRKGSVGGWRARMTDAQARLIERYAGNALSCLGYPIECEVSSKEMTNQLGNPPH
jgi:hypothetical protein